MTRGQPKFISLCILEVWPPCHSSERSIQYDRLIYIHDGRYIKLVSEFSRSIMIKVLIVKDVIIRKPCLPLDFPLPYRCCLLLSRNGVGWEIGFSTSSQLRLISPGVLVFNKSATLLLY